MMVNKKLTVPVGRALPTLSRSTLGPSVVRADTSLATCTRAAVPAT